MKSKRFLIKSSLSEAIQNSTQKYTADPSLRVPFAQSSFHVIPRIYLDLSVQDDPLFIYLFILIMHGISSRVLYRLLLIKNPQGTENSISYR